MKAWLADKDAEALRYQKLLVEEEEAAQKRYVSVYFHRELIRLFATRRARLESREKRSISEGRIKYWILECLG